MVRDRQSSERECGACSLCCTVLRVDELGKLGGTPCDHQRARGGCGIHPERPGICRAYRCLWLSGGLADDDRPDRLAAVIDILSQGMTTRLSIQEAEPGAFDASPRLRQIAEEFRVSMPVRIVAAGNVLDPDRPFRVLLPGGEEQRVRGEVIEILRDGKLVEERRQPWLDRMVRRLTIAVRRLRVAGARHPD
jgi:hypothetical protein